MNTESRKQLMRIDAAGLAILAALSVAAYFGGLEPILAQQSVSEMQKTALNAKREESTRLTSNLTAMRAHLVKVRQAVKASSIQLHVTGHLNQHLSDVAQVAGVCNLRVDEIKPGHVAAGLRYEQVPIEISGNGTYRTCTEFLQKLHVAFPDTGVTALEIRGNPADEKHRATFRFGLIWYASPSSKGGGAATSLTAAEERRP